MRKQKGNDWFRWKHLCFVVGAKRYKNIRTPLFLFVTVLFLVIGLSGVTYAWNSISQNAVNDFFAKTEEVPVELVKLEKLPDGTLTEIPISDVKFYLYQEDGTRIGGIYTTDAFGKIIQRLAPGNYYFTEIAVKDGYTFDVDEEGNSKTTYPFTVTGEEELVTVRAYNIRKQGTLTIEKWVQNADESELREEQYEQNFAFRVTFSDVGTYQYRIDGGELQSISSGEVLYLKHGQKAMFENLPMGVTYTITEELVEHYWVKAEGHRGTVTESGKVAIFTNIYNEQTENVSVKIYVTKVMEGSVPDADVDKSFDMNLTINGEQIDFSLKNGETAEFDAWTGDLYEVSEKDYIEEGCYQQISNGFGNVFGDTYVTVTNTYQKEIKKKISVEKIWQLNGASDDVIPDFIIVQLKQDDMVIDEKKVTPDENGSWNVTFDAPKYDADGNEIFYTVEELPIDGFRTEYDTSRMEEGIVTIVNIHQPPIQVWLPVIEKQVLGTNVPLTRFEFWLHGKDGAPMPEGAVGQTKMVSIDQSGQIDFGSIWFTEAGEYHYTLIEVDAGKEGWMYDQSEYEIVFTVYERDGQLQAYFNIYKDGDWMDHILFQNTYENPEEPDNPKDNPESPKDDPENPEDQPNNPEKPDNPENPEDQPENPDSIEKSEGSQEGSKKVDHADNPSESGAVSQTGDHVGIMRYIISLCLSFGLLVKFGFGRRKNISDK